MTDLGTVGGVNSIALGINGSGQVAGFADSGGPVNLSHAYVYSNGSFTNLGTLPGCIESAATGINSSGQVVGGSDNDTPSYSYAFLYSNGAMTSLRTLSGDNESLAYGINTNGQVVGISWDWTTGSNHLFLYSNGQMSNLGLPLGTPGSAMAINEKGLVVGSYTPAGGASQAFIYGHGAVTGLGTAGFKTSYLDSLNNVGQAVGAAASPASNGVYLYHAIVYSDGAMTDLNNLVPSDCGWTLEMARGINDSGAIVGWGTDPAGQTEAFLLTPVPEPSTLALLGIGAVSLLGYAWRWRTKAL